MESFEPAGVYLEISQSFPGKARGTGSLWFYFSDYYYQN